MSLFLSIKLGAQQVGPGRAGAGGAAMISSPTVDVMSAVARGSVPRLVRLSGVINPQVEQTTQTTVGGAAEPQPPKRIGVTFSLYELQGGGEPLWSESQSLELDSQGQYTVLLGATLPEGLPLDLFTSGKALWLGIQPQLPGAGEQPRVLLAAMPYALKAADADTLGGKPAAAFLTVDSLPAAPVEAPASQSANDPIRATDLRQPTPNFNSGSCSAVKSDGTAKVNGIAKFTSACNIEMAALYESGGNVGIGNTKPAGPLDVSGNTFVRGTLQLPSLGTATSTSGFSSNPLDLVASSFNGSAAVDQLFRWQAEPVDNNSSVASGRVSLLFGSGGTAPAETGLSIDALGNITFAPGQTFPGMGTVTSVGSGAGLTGGPIAGSGTLSIATSGVTNAMLTNPFVTVTAGTGLSGGGAATLGTAVTLNVDSTKVPLLAANSNSFAGSISAKSFTGNGSALTNLSAANLTSGTLPSSALSGTYSLALTFPNASNSFVGDGSGLTNVNAATAATANNALNLGGLPPTAYQPAGSYATTGANKFTGNESVTGDVTATGQLSGGSENLTGSLTGTTATFSSALSAAGVALPATGVATSSSGANSNPLDLQASSFNSTTQAAVAQDFRWLAESAANNTAAPSATLNLQYGSAGSGPQETGLAIGSNGVINFVSQQTFPQASATSQGVLMLANDLGGTAAAPLVAGLQGRPLSNSAPAANQVLTWNGSAWVPANPGGGTGSPSGSGTSGYLAEWTTGNTLGNSPIVDASGSVTSSEPVVAPSLNTNGSGAGVVRIAFGATSAAWTLGTGAPTGACSVGSLFSRTDGASGSTLYVCEGPSGTWMAK